MTRRRGHPALFVLCVLALLGALYTGWLAGVLLLGVALWRLVR